MENLHITLIQSDLYWEDRTKNLEQFKLKIENLNKKADLIVLPETFTTGFSMTATSLAENMDGMTMTWLADMAKMKNAAICGSFLAQENGHRRKNPQL